jgi:CRISPR-associated protein Csb2
MTLVLEIEYLLGVAFAARSQASDMPDWPPQPDRVFSALVAAWGARGERDKERLALEWLERQPEPEIIASGGFPRTAPTVFVPPNDPATGRVADRSLMPAFRRRQPRRFPAYRPHSFVAELVWRDVTADAATMAALNALAADTPYVGHSSSLTRCRFRTDCTPEPSARPVRRIYPGRLAELEQVYRAGRRPSPGDTARVELGTERLPIASIFSNQWLVLEHVGGEMPDIRAAALVAKALHRTVIAGYERIGLGDTVPAAISGHTPDGTPLSEPHLAFAPMAFLGSPYADGGVFGLALIPPRNVNLHADPAFRRALLAITHWAEAKGRRELVLDCGGLRPAFAPAGEPTRRSLDPTRYVADAQIWATCTPIVLDRHLKQKDNAGREAEIEGLVRRACRNIGLPEPVQVVPAKHSAVEGAPSAYPSGGAPTWTGWRLPPSLANRQLTHVVLQFEDPVRGPVILGSGRFVGLGLCRALDPIEHRT